MCYVMAKYFLKIGGHLWWDNECKQGACWSVDSIILFLFLHYHSFKIEKGGSRVTFAPFTTKALPQPLLVRTHRLGCIVEPVPHNDIPVPATSSQQLILGVKGHTVQRAGTKMGPYIVTFRGGPHLRAGKTCHSRIRENLFKWCVLLNSSW